MSLNNNFDEELTGSFHSFNKSDGDFTEISDLSNIPLEKTLADEKELELESSSTITLSDSNVNKTIPDKLRNWDITTDCVDHYAVAVPRSDTPMPDMEVFDMEDMETKQYMAAKQKLAFTEIWIENQHDNRSLRGRFAEALDDYFKKPISQPKAEENMDLSEEKPYISPFEDMKVEPVEKKLSTGKKAITVPAGFDLTNLVEYRNPNHWHRRATTRNDINP